MKENGNILVLYPRFIKTFLGYNLNTDIMDRTLTSSFMHSKKDLAKIHLAW